MTRRHESHSSGSARLLTAAALLLLAPMATLAAGQPPDLAIQEANGVYTVVARFLVDRPPAAAWAVLTDYERIPRFMPDVRTSIVRERAPGRAVVEQEAVSSVMVFSKRVHLVLDIDEQPDALVFTDECGSSFVRYEGAWRLSDQGGRTAITYELTAQPSFDVPSFLLKRLLRRDSSQMIERLRREIDSRAVPTGTIPSASR
ncbi:MAG TPA: SRPBCC family protein [Vicinamibacterales bacterium]|jgi:carbon monoxide dehydrogenase subunit G|nr:SRPBCC family protein [Vicinamibacterales bacterium]